MLSMYVHGGILFRFGEQRKKLVTTDDSHIPRKVI
jgi:hypothetical protein